MSNRKSNKDYTCAPLSRGEGPGVRLLFFYLLFIFTTPALSQNTRATATLDTTAIRIGEQVKLQLSVTHKGKNIQWPAFGDTIVTGIEIIDRDQPARTTTEAGSVTDRQTLIITSFDSGFRVIPPILFIIDGDTAETEPLLLEVNTVQADTTQDIKDITGIMDEPFTWQEAMPYVYWGLGILAAGTLLIFLIKKLTKKKPVTEQKPKIVIPPHITALQSLEKLRAQKLWQEGKVKQYHSALTDIVRLYIEERFKVNALEQTTDEILASFRNVVIDQGSKAKLKQLLTLADLVKFAKEEPLPQDNELSMANAFDFVNGTKREDIIAGAGENTGIKQ